MKKGLVERTASVNIRELRRAEHLAPGAARVVLIRKDLEREAVAVAWINARLGGRRAYFVCPGCDRRAEILYCAPWLACRKCHGLAYRSENLTPIERKRQRLHKFQESAGVDISRFPSPIPAKPKWQRWHSYINLRRKIEEADHRFASAYLASRHGRVLR
jgi:hypothetical protein